MDALLDRRVVIALAVAGGIFSVLASILAVRGKGSGKAARNLNYAGYAFMATSMVLFVLAGLTGAGR